jgi:hypothetical protein
VALNVNAPHLGSPGSRITQQLTLRSFDVHLDEVRRSRSLEERRWAQRRNRLVAISRDAIAIRVRGRRHRDETVIRPHSGVEEMAAIGPPLEILLGERKIILGELNTEDLRDRIPDREVGHG